MRAADLFQNIAGAEALDLAGKTPESRKKSFSYLMNKLKDRIFSLKDDTGNSISLQVIESGKMQRAALWEVVNVDHYEEDRQLGKLF